MGKEQDQARAVCVQQFATVLCRRDPIDAFVTLVGAVIASCETAPGDRAEELYAAADRTISIARAAHLARRTNAATQPVSCPACNAPVFVDRASDRELIACPNVGCGAALITARNLDGSTALHRIEKPNGASA